MLKRGNCLVAVFILVVLASFSVSASNAVVVSSPFHYSFNINGTLYEAGEMQETSSPYWWLNSGAKLIISNGTGKTVQRELLSNEKWRLIYLNENPLDTDNGFHPQNIFRMITRSKWQSFNQTAYFKINMDQLSVSQNREGYNGLLLMSRYIDEDNLYYTGIRVDGNAIIKKKINGKYYTLASKKIFPGTYNRLTNPNLLPKNTWIGLKSQIITTNGKVNIKVYMDNRKTGKWVLIAEVNDDGSLYGKPITTEGYTGIRTDFMDVEFDDFSLVKI